MTRRSLAHRDTGSQDQAPEIVEVPASNYVDPDRFEREKTRVFGRLPLVVGASAEVAERGDYLSVDLGEMPVLVSRGDDGALRAFHNSCSHRGAIVTPLGAGTARRHTCPYHAWSYDRQGQLVGVLDAEDFGPVDRACAGLTELRCEEQAGLVWVHPRREAAIDLDTFLCGYGPLLHHLDLAACHPVGRQQIEGPNWKIAYDGYLDFYHLPILHRDSFGADIANKALYDAWGPHQRVNAPARLGSTRFDRPEAEWPTADLVGGVWTIFPHVSIASFDAAGRVWMVSLLQPGSDVGSSVTTQLFLHTGEPGEDRDAAVAEMMAFNRHVVADEDYRTGFGIQRALRAGAHDKVRFGRNEGGGQRFHGFLDRLLSTTDEDLVDLFAAETNEGVVAP